MKTLITTLTLLLSINLIGQETTKIDQLELINDIQIWNKEDGRMKFTMWIPNCYWRTSLEGNPEVSEEVVKTAALPGNINPDTGLTYIDDALLSNEEKAMRLRQKGLTA